MYSTDHTIQCKGREGQGELAEREPRNRRRDEMKLDEMRGRVFSFLEKTVRAPQQMGWDEDAFEKRRKEREKKGKERKWQIG